ncbi:MAG: hypothetical protein EBR30_27915 [Cytophagia bacterium]|nr:hypothetical protein [Cytophagia bacterium]
MGKKMYGRLHDEAQIWDDKRSHLQLLERLSEEFPDGWALSCNPKDLRWLLPTMPEDVRICAWTKTFYQIRSVSVQYAWEPVLLRGGRKIGSRDRPLVLDWLSCARSMKKGVPGAKPHRFNQWILELLGYDSREDELVDLFPGSGGMALALAEVKLSDK